MNAMNLYFVNGEFYLHQMGFLNFVLKLMTAMMMIGMMIGMIMVMMISIYVMILMRQYVKVFHYVIGQMKAA